MTAQSEFLRMMTNVGVLDGAFRIALGLLLVAWADGELGAHPPEFWGWAAWIGGAALALTGLFRFSPLYAWRGIDSCAPCPRDAS